MNPELRAHRAVQRKLAATYAEAHALRQRQIAECMQFFTKQSARIEALPVHPHKPVDGGGSYSLETRGGSHPHTVALTETPLELQKKSGEVGYRVAGSLSVVPGS